MRKQATRHCALSLPNCLALAVGAAHRGRSASRERRRSACGRCEEMTMWCSTVGFIITFALSLLVAPRAAEAQQAGKVWRISFLTLRPGEDIAKKILLERLHELGYIEGKHVKCEYRSAEGYAERL